ncbi:Uncharacterized protein HZ326_11559 [Fusarium oxysporum f. sp. albedinis]|nr:Uncharacterized protein HZ326_11559 [Fusarium oxysporum f. sp. albedinis]
MPESKDQGLTPLRCTDCITREYSLPSFWCQGTNLMCSGKNPFVARSLSRCSVGFTKILETPSPNLSILLLYPMHIGKILPKRNLALHCYILCTTMGWVNGRLWTDRRGFNLRCNANSNSKE